ncbi:MAG: hypothetical protein Q4B83_08495 [Ligilactobacillus murinus]|nr:hypothetical protein [Ligilactobacillus murinus]
MKKQLRVLGVLVCLLPLMTGCLPQTKDKQGSSSSHKTSQTTKKKASSSFSSSETKVSETSSSRAAASHAPVTKGVAGEQPVSDSVVGQTLPNGMDFYYHLAIQAGICDQSVSPEDFYREATLGDQQVTYQGHTVTVKLIHKGEGAYEQNGETMIDNSIYEIVSVN